MHFDSEQKIQQIRLYWDQASLLKTVEVIGARARNWPITDGKDQVRLIASGEAATSRTAQDKISKEGDVVITSRQVSPRKGVDPRSTLDLFNGPQAEEDTTPSEPTPAPRASAKPPPRDYHDLFVGDGSHAEMADSPTKGDDKRRSMAPKGGAGKNYQASRLFDSGEPEAANGSPTKSPEKHMKPHPTKYNHFEFSDGHDEPKQQAPNPRPKTQHQSHFEFGDVATPEKQPPKPRPQDVRHIGWDGEEENSNTSPTRKSRTAQPRRDAESHFDMRDNPTPEPDRQGANHPRPVAGTNKGLSLYKNNLFDDTEEAKSPEKKSHPLSTVTNLKDRKKDFDPHFTLGESSPGLGEKTASETNRPIPETRQKATNMMDSTWDAPQNSPVTNVQSKPKDKENFGFGDDSLPLRNKGINIAGDGMGGKKGTGRSWGFGDDSDEDGPGGVNGGKFRAAKKQVLQKDSDFWEF